jgi:hypothetical protein
LISFEVLIVVDVNSGSSYTTMSVDERRSITPQRRDLSLRPLRPGVFVSHLFIGFSNRSGHVGDEKDSEDTDYRVKAVVWQTKLLEVSHVAAFDLDTAAMKKNRAYKR